MAWAWHTGRCAGMFWSGEIIPFRKYIDDMAPDPRDTPRDRLEREMRERMAREKALEVEWGFEAGRQERMKIKSGDADESESCSPDPPANS